MLYSRLLVIGDSLSFGSRDEYGSSWPIELSKLALERLGYTILPLVYATPGYTSFQILKESSPILEKWRGKIKELVLQFGTNDAKDENAIPVNVFRGNLETAITWSFGYRLFLFTIPLPCGFGSDGYTRDIVPRIEKYNAEIRDVCQRKGVNLLDLSGLNRREYFGDGIHFSNLGNRAVAKMVLEKILEIRKW